MGLFGGKKNTKETDANSAEKLLRLAEQYDTGNGISMDRERATELYQQAAGMGDAKAQEVLGERYEEGIGTGVDLDKALFWYEQAVSGGRELGRKKILPRQSAGGTVRQKKGMRRRRGLLHQCITMVNLGEQI